MAETERGPRYREIRRLDAGAMASAVLAEDTILRRRVALRRVQTSAADGHRLKRQARARASVSHPSLVFVYDIRIEDDGDLVIVMEYLDGETLSDVLGRRGALPGAEALEVLRELAAGLDALHAKGIAHGQVEPANIVVKGDGTVKLADPGVAGLDEDSSGAESPVGSPAYMPPERLEGAGPTPAADVYALAAVAYELLSGQKARPGSRQASSARASASQPPPDLRDVWPSAPGVAAAVLRRGMAPDPHERPSSAGELAGRIQRALESRPAPQGLPPIKAAPAATPVAAERAMPVVAFAEPQAQEVPRRRSRPRLIPAIAAIAAVVVAAVAAAALTTGAGKRNTRAPSSLAAAARRSPATGKQPAVARPSSVASRGSQASSGSHQTRASTTSASSSQPGTPSGAVEAFYEAAAAHQYPTAWALADASMRSELGGLGSFQDEMSSVRSIAFHRAEVLGGQSPGAATVALETTSVQTDRTQQCAGTANTVRSGQVWLLHGISISCS